MQPIALRGIADSHGAKLVHAKDLPVESYSILTEQHGPGRTEPHSDRNHSHHRRGHQNCKDGENYVECPLQQGISNGFDGGCREVKNLKAPKLEESLLDRHVIA